MIFKSLLSINVKGGLLDINKGLPVSLHHLDDLLPHVTVLGEDLGVVCSEGDGPLTAVIDNLDCADKGLDLLVVRASLPL